MFILDTTSKSITAVMSGAAATTNPNFTAAYADNNGSTFVEGANDGVLNGITAVTLVASPSSSTRRIVKTITIENTDTAAVTVTVGYVNSASTRTIVKVTLQVGDTWTTDGSYDTNGNLKQIIGTVNLATQVTGILGVANGGTGLSSLTANYIPYGNGTSAYQSSSTFTFNGTTFVAPAASLSISALTSSNTSNFQIGGTLSFSDTGIVSNGVGTTNGYLQAVLQNKSNGTAASTEFIAYNDSGTATTNFATVGINSSGYTGTGSINAAGYAFFLSGSTDLVLGTIGSNAIHLVIGSSATDAMTINTTGITSIPSTTYAPNINLTDAATIAWDTSKGQVATFTFVSTNRTMGAPTNLSNGAFYALAVIQNGGSNTLSWNSVFKWANGTAPTLSTAAGAKDYFVFRSDGTNLYQQGISQAVA